MCFYTCISGAKQLNGVHHFPSHSTIELLTLIENERKYNEKNERDESHINMYVVFPWKRHIRSQKRIGRKTSILYNTMLGVSQVSVLSTVNQSYIFVERFPSYDFYLDMCRDDTVVGLLLPMFVTLIKLCALLVLGKNNKVYGYCGYVLT